MGPVRLYPRKVIYSPQYASDPQVSTLFPHFSVEAAEAWHDSNQAFQAVRTRREVGMMASKTWPPHVSAISSCVGDAAWQGDIA